MKKRNILKTVLAGSIILSLISGCTDTAAPDRQDQETMNYEFKFETGTEGWTGGFSDIPVNYAEQDYNPEFKHERIPLEDKSLNGLKLGGMNRSDDMFMYITRLIGDLKPNQEYEIELSFDIATNVPAGLIGIGGAPGESVFVKAGAAQIEPISYEGDYLEIGRHDQAEDQVGIGIGGFTEDDAKREALEQALEGKWLIFNLNKGNQSNGGEDLAVIGNIAKATGSEDDSYELKQFKYAFTSKTNEHGELFVVLGTDSGFEGRTEIYFTNIHIYFKQRKEA